jgi:hypothetical protein
MIPALGERIGEVEVGCFRKAAVLTFSRVRSPLK